MSKQEADAYIRDRKIICVPCSDIEDRDHPTHLKRGDRCSICGEVIEYPISDAMQRVWDEVVTNNPNMR